MIRLRLDYTPRDWQQECHKRLLRFSVLALQHGVIPPTINLDNPGEGCDLDYVPHTARQKQVDAVLSNGFGFGGTNGSLLFKRL